MDERAFDLEEREREEWDDARDRDEQERYWGEQDDE